MRHILIGREGSGNDVEIPDDTVSTHHAEAVRCADGRTFLTDRASTNGTFVFRGGGWQRLRQDFVGKDERVRFGGIELTLGQLLGTSWGLDEEKIAGPVVWTPDGRLEAKK